MPFSTHSRVIDSNVGVVVTCEHLGKWDNPTKVEHPENMTKLESGVNACAICGAIPGSVIHRGGKPKCDLLALAKVIGFENAEKVLDDSQPKTSVN